MRIDTYTGMAVSNLIGFFIILDTAAILHRNGVTDIQTASQAAEALRLVAGEFAFLLFAIGIVGTGLLAIPVLAGSVGYDRRPFEENLKDVDLVLDTVGGDTLDRSWRVVRRGGALISVAEEPPAAKAERFGVSGKFFIVEPNRGQLVELAKLVDDGSLKPIVSQIFPLSAARRAYEVGSQGHLRGKILLRVR
jgi:NADPH:quinone reductase-like Zn-dependent oxidoreductase